MMSIKCFHLFVSVHLESSDVCIPFAVLTEVKKLVRGCVCGTLGRDREHASIKCQRGTVEQAGMNEVGPGRTGLSRICGKD